MLFKKKETEQETWERVYELTDKGDYGLCPPSMNAQIALNELCDFFLGKDWYVVEPIHATQVNPIIVYEIERKIIKYKKN